MERVASALESDQASVESYEPVERCNCVIKARGEDHCMAGNGSSTMGTLLPEASRPRAKCLGITVTEDLL